MKRITLLTIAVFSLGLANAQTKWSIDPSHSKVGFSVSHLVISEVEGKFDKFSATMEHTKEDFSDAKISFEANVNSINTDNDQRDGHLKSEDFFYAEKYPKMTFKSTSFKKKSGNKYVLKGNLTMRGVTKSVTLNVKHGGTIANDGYGNTKSGFIISGEINRIDYGVAWNAKTEHGGWTVGEEVALTIKLELVKQK